MHYINITLVIVYCKAHLDILISVQALTLQCILTYFNMPSTSLNFFSQRKALQDPLYPCNNLMEGNLTTEHMSSW